MQARYYDPVIGRFYSNDPVDSVSHLSRTGGIHGFNRYTYANNNPYKYKDPDGNESRFAIEAAADTRAYTSGKVSRKQLKSRMATRGRAARIAIRNIPAGRVANAILTVANIALNSSSDTSTENKGQGQAEVGDCPTCGGETSNKPGKIGSAHGLKPKEVTDAIHGVKGAAGLPNNPDVEVCNDCGEVFPQAEDGTLGDSIGNIEDHEK